MANDGGPAFPAPVLRGSGGDYYTSYEGGLTVRDYFAIHAPSPSEDEIRFIEEREGMANPYNEPYNGKPRRRSRNEIVCDLRYQFADAMLKEREKFND